MPATTRALMREAATPNILLSQALKKYSSGQISPSLSPLECAFIGDGVIGNELPQDSDMISIIGKRGVCAENKVEGIQGEERAEG